MKLRHLLLPLFLILFCVSAFGQANGKLQIHFMNVGQGDGAVLISPNGEVVLFDDGVRGLCGRPVSYLQQLGVTSIQYHITSHYHDDHIGCTKEVLAEFPLQKFAYDRGGTYPSTNQPGGTFFKYKQAVGSKRKTASLGTTITLDGNTDSPVQISFVASNGNGIQTENENDMSLVAVVTFGKFNAVIGGDLSGFNKSFYKDIETSVAPKVGQVELYKVNHHGSQYSTNTTWINTIKPRIGIISVGTNKDHGHPTQDCLKRLHDAGIKTYWTDSGTGANPKAGWDIVGGNIIVEVGTPNSAKFTVSYNGGHDEDEYSMWPAVNNNFAANTTSITSNTTEAATSPKYAWSKKAKVYHYASCIYVHNIHPDNYESGNTAPQDKSLHTNCPK
jgi:beta-lactamase superfamily II metal-dependent hydrolase